MAAPTPSMCFRVLQLSQSLGTAGTCAGVGRRMPRWVQTELAASGRLNFGPGKKRSYWHLLNEETSLLLPQFFFYPLLARLGIDSRDRSAWKAYRTLSEERHRHRNSLNRKRGDCLLSLCYCDCFSRSLGWGPNKTKQQRRQKEGEKKQSTSASLQQLTVLGCCLHTKSEMKSNSFCPRKSSGSS